MGLDLDFAAIDHHGCPLLHPKIAANLPYAAIFTDRNDSDVIRQQVPQTLSYRRGLNTMATLLGCEPTAEAIATRRRELGWAALVALCFKSANLSTILLDDSLLPEACLPVSWHQNQIKTHRILALEPLAERLLPQVTQFEVFLEWFRSELDPPPAGVVAFKSIAAERGGLKIQPTDFEQAALSFDEVLQRAADNPSEAVRLDAVLAHFLLAQALDIANKHGLPVQVHTALGAASQDLSLASPLNLRPLLEIPACRQVPIILLTGKPFTRETAYLAAAYPQVYVDYGRMIHVSSTGAQRTLQTLLEFCPTDKIVYGSGARFLPDAFYLAAKQGRRALAQVLEAAMAAGDLTGREAEAIAIAILRGNSQRLYNIGPVA
ncbi:MAG: amidohydrolase family protein [Elainellaceae cyanobacterium]